MSLTRHAGRVRDRGQYRPRRRARRKAERARGTEHNPALRKLANRLVGILHGCLKTRTLYDEATADPTTKTGSLLDIQAPGMCVLPGHSRQATLRVNVMVQLRRAQGW
jgi:hypothetical protein